MILQMVFLPISVCGGHEDAPLRSVGGSGMDQQPQLQPSGSIIVSAQGHASPRLSQDLTVHGKGTSAGHRVAERLR